MITTKIGNEFLEILDRVPLLNTFLKIGGVFLAGGALRTLISTTEEFSPETTDIDLFFRNRKSLLASQFLIEKSQYYKSYQCPEGKLSSYVYLDGENEVKWRIQFITIGYYKDMTNLLESFDFTPTMFATDGENFVYGDTAVQDTLDKHLQWNKITYPASSLRRMMKYARKGYWMNEKDYQEFIEKVWSHDWRIVDEALVYVD